MKSIIKHRFLSLLTSAAVIFSGRTSLSADAAVTLAGDLNCDGQITVADAVMLGRLLAEDTSLELSPQGIDNADCDLDGLLCMADVRRVLVEAAETTASTTTATTATTTTTTTTTTVPATTPAPIVTAAPETAAPPVVTEPPGPVYSQVGDLRVSPYPLIVHRNEEVTLEVIGLPNTEYDINVYYSSSVSKAKGLENHFSNGNGYVSWTWKIGGSTNFGNYYIDLIGGGVKTRVEFSVVS